MLLSGLQLRPDIIDVLFLGSFSYTFQRVERNKIKGKTGKILHENAKYLENNSI